MAKLVMKVLVCVHKTEKSMVWKLAVLWEKKRCAWWELTVCTRGKLRGNPQEQFQRGLGCQVHIRRGINHGIFAVGVMDGFSTDIVFSLHFPGLL